MFRNQDTSASSLLGLDTCTCVLVQVYEREKHSLYSTSAAQRDITGNITSSPCEMSSRQAV